MRIAAGPLLQVHQRQHLIDPSLALGARPRLQAIGHVLRHRHVRKKGVLLKHHAHTLQGATGTLPRQPQLSISNGLQTRNGPQQGGLAAPRGPKKHADLAFVHAQGDGSNSGQRLPGIGDRDLV